jgi:hypothetical protein
MKLPFIPREKKLLSWVRILRQQRAFDADRSLHSQDRWGQECVGTTTMDLVVVTDVTQRLVDELRGALLVRIEIVDKSHRHGL